MQNLIRLAYISRPTEAHKNIDYIQVVADQILAKAHLFNEKKDITGILCFSNDCYFQCLEGAKDAVEPLYSKLLNDPRHTDLKIVLKESILTRSFANWCMKYVEDIQVIMPLIKLHGHKTFSPYDFGENLFLDLLDLLSQKCADGKC